VRNIAWDSFGTRPRWHPCSRSNLDFQASHPLKCQRFCRFPACVSACPSGLPLFGSRGCGKSISEIGSAALNQPRLCDFSSRVRTSAERSKASGRPFQLGVPVSVCLSATASSRAVKIDFLVSVFNGKRRARIQPNCLAVRCDVLGTQVAPIGMRQMEQAQLLSYVASP